MWLYDFGFSSEADQWNFTKVIIKQVYESLEL